MEFEDIRVLLALLLEAHIPVCIVGELALNYYNAPRIVHVCSFPTLQSFSCSLTSVVIGS